MFHMQERQLLLSPLFKNLSIMPLGVFLVINFFDFFDVFQVQSVSTHYLKIMHTCSAWC